LSSGFRMIKLKKLINNGRHTKLDKHVIFMKYKIRWSQTVTGC